MLVLLTDGDDNHLDSSIVRDHRSKACTAAKTAGIEIITVFAGDPSRDLKDELLACASPADDRRRNELLYRYNDLEELEGAFETISQRLRRCDSCAKRTGYAVFYFMRRRKEGDTGLYNRKENLARKRIR